MKGNTLVMEERRLRAVGTVQEHSHNKAYSQAKIMAAAVTSRQAPALRLNG